MVIYLAEYLERRERAPRPLTDDSMFGTDDDLAAFTPMRAHAHGRWRGLALAAAPEAWPEPYPAHLHILYADASLI